MNGPKLRPETSASIVMGEVGGMRDVFVTEARLFVVLVGSNAWPFSSFCGACF